MAKKLHFTLPILAAFLFMGLCISPAFAAKPESPIIINVQHDYDTGVLTITGENLSESTIMPVVTLNGVSLDVGSWDDKLVTATATAGFPVPGDYELLFDSTLKKTEPVKMMLTLGTIGPAGADGAPGADGVDGVDGDPGINLPITCEIGEALNGIDETGLPVCVPLSAVSVEGEWNRVDHGFQAIAACPPGHVVDRLASGITLTHAYFTSCPMYPSDLAPSISYIAITQLSCTVQVRDLEYCVDWLKCVAVCEPA